MPCSMFLPYSSNVCRRRAGAALHEQTTPEWKYSDNADKLSYLSGLPEARPAETPIKRQDPD